MLFDSQVICIVSVHFDDVKGDRLLTTMRGMSITSDQVRHTLYLISAVHRDHRHAGTTSQKNGILIFILVCIGERTDHPDIAVITLHYRQSLVNSSSNIPIRLSTPFTSNYPFNFNSLPPFFFRYFNNAITN